ncbi:MAG: hypothetical protein Q8O35_14170 [Humidesulfovibrio sp.]|uniref:hypothetical protein n=1 Tax=Humidesulfovibrio sp. TaxID=2910988 RepID=UPI00273296B7|nr:hypothetical protein [Humidesulfovibrio sp.]MDP2849315.1 hypothetical protein [Humidesulfovibrio sp.]
MHADSSLTKHENELSRSLRQRVNSAESTQDVQNAFAAFLRDMLSRATGSEVVLDEGDVRVDPKVEDGFILGPGITANKDFAGFLERSDLLPILRRQAIDSVNRINHLGKNTVRAEAKIFQRPDRKF